MSDRHTICEYSVRQFGWSVVRSILRLKGLKRLYRLNGRSKSVRSFESSVVRLFRGLKRLNELNGLKGLEQAARCHLTVEFWVVCCLLQAASC